MQNLLLWKHLYVRFVRTLPVLLAQLYKNTKTVKLDLQERRQQYGSINNFKAKCLIANNFKYTYSVHLIVVHLSTLIVISCHLFLGLTNDFFHQKFVCPKPSVYCHIFRMYLELTLWNCEEHKHRLFGWKWNVNGKRRRWRISWSNLRYNHDICLEKPQSRYLTWLPRFKLGTFVWSSVRGLHSSRVGTHLAKSSKTNRAVARYMT